VGAQNGYAWWKNGWIRTTIISTLIFLMGIGVGQELPRLIFHERPDYSIGNDYWRMTWDFKKERPEGSKSYQLERLALQYFAANLAIATLVSSDSNVNGTMLARLVLSMSAASNRNITTADSVVMADSASSPQADSLAGLERRKARVGDSVR